MTHPYFSAAWRTDLLYTWDSRTATGVLDLRPCRDRQIFSLSAASGVRLRSWAILRSCRIYLSSKVEPSFLVS